MNGMRNGGDLDPEFSEKGENSEKGHVHLGGASGPSYLLPDGNLLSVGVAEWRTAILCRRLADGSLDSTFGTEGVIRTPLGIAVGEFVMTSAFLQRDGKVLIGGFVDLERVPGTPETSYLCYVRLTPEGQLDGSFGVGGRAAINLPNTPIDESDSTVVRADGKILSIAKSIWGFDMIDNVLFRMNADGTVDTTFGHGGFTYEFPTKAYLWGLQTLRDGKILLSGSAHGDGMLTRLEEDGRIDSTFGRNGHFFLDVAEKSVFDQIAHATMQDDGKILIVGSTGAPQTAFIARLEKDASGLDPEFNGGKPLLLPWGEAGNYESRVAVQADGRIVSLGYTFGVSTSFTLRRFLPDGSPDVSFGRDGVVEVVSEKNVFRPMNHLEIQPDGKYVVSGGTLNFDVGWFMSIYRFLPD